MITRINEWKLFGSKEDHISTDILDGFYVKLRMEHMSKAEQILKLKNIKYKKVDDDLFVANKYVLDYVHELFNKELGTHW